MKRRYASNARQAAMSLPPPVAEGPATGQNRFSDKEILELARLIIDEHSLPDMHSLRAMDPEVHAAIAQRELASRLFLRGNEDEGMYLSIFKDCFRIGTANPFIGKHWGFVPKLRRTAESLTNGSRERFEKCWEKLARCGVISLHEKRTMASLDISVDVEDGEMRRSLRAALAEQAKVSAFWQVKLEGPMKQNS